MRQPRCTNTSATSSPTMPPPITAIRAPSGTSFHTKVRDARMLGDALHFTEDGVTREIAGVTHVIAAIGALPNLDALPAVEASGIPFTVVGDANQPGDFLSVLRDASMVGLALGMVPAKQEHMA